MSLTRRLILQKARHHHPHSRRGKGGSGCRHTVSGTLSLPLPLSPFPHGTNPLSGHRGVFRLTGWSRRRRIPRARCYCEIDRRVPVSRTGSHRLRADHPRPLPLTTTCFDCLSAGYGRDISSHNPAHNPYPVTHAVRFGLFRRSPLLAESQLFFLSSYGTEDVSLPTIRTLYIQMRAARTPLVLGSIQEISDPRSVDSSPEAYHSLPRPSSALDAKASTMRPWVLTNTAKPRILHKSTPPLAGSVSVITATTIQFSKHHPTTRRWDNTWNSPSVASGLTVCWWPALLSCTRLSPTTTPHCYAPPVGVFVVLLRRRVSPHLRLRDSSQSPIPPSTAPSRG